MIFTFHEHIGQFIHVYLDNVFIFSMSLEEHEEHFGKVL
jgi:hypothetical protein